MRTDDDRIGRARLWSSVLGSLVPWAALLMTVSLTEDNLLLDVLPAAAVLWLVFVAVPSMVAIVVGRSAVTRVVVTVVMTGVAVFAGVQMAAIDDGQAGFAVVLVPMVAYPLAGVVWAGGAAMRRWSTPRRPRARRQSPR
jgi:hypothetical protein